MCRSDDLSHRESPGEASRVAVKRVEEVDADAKRGAGASLVVELSFFAGGGRALNKFFHAATWLLVTLGESGSVACATSLELHAPSLA